MAIEELNRNLGTRVCYLTRVGGSRCAGIGSPVVAAETHEIAAIMPAVLDVAAELQAAPGTQFTFARGPWAVGQLYLPAGRNALVAQCDEGVDGIFELAGAAVEELAEAYRVALAAGDFTVSESATEEATVQRAAPGGDRAGVPQTAAVADDGRWL